jgi:hypothetical protein
MEACTVGNLRNGGFRGQKFLGSTDSDILDVLVVGNSRVFFEKSREMKFGITSILSSII